MAARRLAVVVSGFPRRSETFAVNELAALDERGLLAAIFATKPGELFEADSRVVRLMRLLRVLPEGTAAEQASALVAALPPTRAAGVHAYFAHTPADVAERAAMAAGLPFGFSMHARDARKVDTSVLARRASHAVCAIACNADVAAELHGPVRATLVPHGVDIDRFAPGETRTGDVFRLLAVGRLVEKKGFDVLIDAAARVERATVRIIGEGPEREQLEARVRQAGLSDRVRLAGPKAHTELPGEYAQADVVVVPSIIDGSGDRDGLPNVVLEAMAAGRPVIGTRVAAIGTAVTHGMTGLLVPPRAPDALARAIRWLADHPGERAAMGRAGRRVACLEYSLPRCAGRFCDVLEAAYA